MAASIPDDVFARALNQMGAVSLDQIETAKAFQAENANKGILLTLPDALIQQGLITPAIHENVKRKLQALQDGGVIQLAHFKLLKKLGEGAMGAVYLADDLNVGRQVALKVLPKKYAGDPEFVTRFRREAKSAGALNHPNIAGAYVVGEEQGYHYLAMEYCNGEPLDKLLKREGPMPWEKALEITIQVARGLQHANEHGIIHRDIKPGNIMLCKPLGKGPPLAKILDFGLSKNLVSGERSFSTQTGIALGTPQYISPEQARGDKEIDGRADIYSLGATFFRLATGQTPFHGETATAIIMKHLNDPVPDARIINGKIPGAVAQIIQRMMAKQPADRYADCKQLIADLEAATNSPDAETMTAPAGKRAPVSDPGVVHDVTTKKMSRVLHAGLATAALLLLSTVLFLMLRSKPGTQQVGGADSAKTTAGEASLRFSAEAKPGTAPTLPKEISMDLGGVKMDMVCIPAGEFKMGSNDGDEAEKPVHKVVISRLFYMAKFEVTVAQFRVFAEATKYQTDAEKMKKGATTFGQAWLWERDGVNWRAPGFPQKDDHAVCVISWNDAQQFCNWANGLGRKCLPNSLPPAKGFAIRLPTEAEWEYSCRAGSTAAFSGVDDQTALEETALFKKNSGWHTNRVGQKKPNAWGLYDMHGNLWEWVSDRFDGKYYASSPVFDPHGPAVGNEYVKRGGAWDTDPILCRASCRSHALPDLRYANSGFRIVLQFEPTP